MWAAKLVGAPGSSDGSRVLPNRRAVMNVEDVRGMIQIVAFLSQYCDEAGVDTLAWTLQVGVGGRCD